MSIKRTLAALVLAGAAASATQAQAETPNIATGFQFVAPEGYTAGTGLGQLHAMFEIVDNLWLGLGFGFNNKFDEVLTGVDVRYHLVAKGNASFFTIMHAYFLNRYDTATTTQAGASIMIPGFGIDYAVTPNFHVSSSWGLNMRVGGAFGIGITRSLLGNMAMHWHF